MLSANSEQLQLLAKIIVWGLEGLAVEIQYQQITATMQLLRELCSNTHSCCGCKTYTEHKVWIIHAEAMAIDGWMLDFSSNGTPVSRVGHIHLLIFISFFLGLVWQHWKTACQWTCARYIYSATSTPPKAHYLQGFRLDSEQEAALSSCKEQRSAHAV